jgi:hypothetical protein
MSSRPGLSGTERDAAINRFAEQYPEDDPHAREVRDAADLADERRPAPSRKVVSAFFSRGRRAR